MENDPRSQVPCALTIAGSDSGGGAGIQTDLKTFRALGVFGTSAITCITAQNPDEVTGVEPISPAMVALQIRTVCAGFPIAAAKTGMLYSAAIIESVAASLDDADISLLVVDPVMVATSGARLLQEDAIEALRELILPKATLITPNVPEAELLAGMSIDSIDDLKQAAMTIVDRFGSACVVKGGHMTGDLVSDFLVADGEQHLFALPRVKGRESHGTGCTFSAAICALLAGGMDMIPAVKRSKEFVAAAIEHAWNVGTRHALGV